jgi:hypothetical protein
MHSIRAIAGRQAVLVAALYILVTVGMTWPLAPNADSAVQDPGDPLMQIWVMRSIQHQLVTDPLNLWHGTAFYPFEQSLAYSEEAIATALLAWPVYLLTGNDILAYNVLLLGSFWLMALAVFLLARELGAYPGAAFVAGILAAFAPARFGHLSHLNMLVLGWLPLAMWAFAVFCHGGKRRYLLVGGIALGIQLFSSLHLAVFATLALGMFLLFLLYFDRTKRPWAPSDKYLIITALLLPYLLFAPTLVPHLEVGERYGFERSRADVDMFASSPGAYLTVLPINQFWGTRLDVRQEPRFPGGVALVGAVAAITFRRRWMVACAALITIIAMLLSFGLSIAVAGRTVPMPYALVYDLFPPIRTIRGVGRFGLLTVIGIPLLAAFGYTGLWRHLRRRIGAHARYAGLALSGLLVLTACIELRTTVATAPVPTAHELSVYEWLADQPAGPVAEFPANGLRLATQATPEEVFQPIRYMYGSTRHWNRILAGYSSFIPPAHMEILAQFDRTGDRLSHVDAMNVGILQDLGIRWVIFHHLPGYDWEAAIASANALPQLTFVAEIGDSVVYEMNSSDHRPAIEQLGSLELDSETTTDVPCIVTIRLKNPHDNLALVHLGAQYDLRVRWRDAAGQIVHDDTIPFQIPVVLQPGETMLRVPISAPAASGTYIAQATVVQGILEADERQVLVHDRPRWASPPLELVSMNWDRTTPLHRGDVLHVDVTLRVRAPLDDDFAATAQILDAKGERRANHDLLPEHGALATSSWVPGQLVTLRFDIPIVRNLEPGDYQILVAIYAPIPGYPRIPVSLPSGIAATEVLDSGVRVLP